MQPLFRKEAIAHKQDVFLGDVLLVRPVSFSVLTLFYIAVAAALLTYLIIGEYTKKARVSGYIVSAQGVIKIHSQQVGSVVRLLVTEGNMSTVGTFLRLYLVSAVAKTAAFKESLQSNFYFDARVTLRSNSKSADNTRNNKIPFKNRLFNSAWRMTN